MTLLVPRYYTTYFALLPSYLRAIYMLYVNTKIKILAQEYTLLQKYSQEVHFNKRTCCKNLVELFSPMSVNEYTFMQENVKCRKHEKW